MRAAAKKLLERTVWSDEQSFRVPFRESASIDPSLKGVPIDTRMVDKVVGVRGRTDLTASRRYIGSGPVGTLDVYGGFHTVFLVVLNLATSGLNV